MSPWVRDKSDKRRTTWHVPSHDRRVQFTKKGAKRTLQTDATARRNQALRVLRARVFAPGARKKAPIAQMYKWGD